MNDFYSRLSNAAASAALGGTASASIGTSVVGGVSAIGGTFFGPVGTFFGASVGSGVGATVGGAIGTIGGFIGGFFFD